MAKSSPALARPAPATDERRGFMTKAAAVVLGGLVALIPAATGLAVFLDPLRRKAKGSTFIPVAPLGAVPDDGIPRQFPVVAEHVDAWNVSTQPIGAVYLRRLPGEAQPECLTATCPHAGCFVAYDGATNTFKCPCHNSSFAVDGAIIEPSPSPRAMDTLPCEVNADEILVKFENFYTGKADKVVKQ
jgi:menaquinol-cytochrome c reductase iron-sulfur subunit